MVCYQYESFFFQMMYASFPGFSTILNINMCYYQLFEYFIYLTTLCFRNEEFLSLQEL